MNLNELGNQLTDLPNTENIPTLFVGHGNPINALYDNPFTQALNKIGNNLTKRTDIQAIMVVSAHWLTNGTFVSTKPNPETIYDFGGFPDELFKIKYPAKGSPEFAQKVKETSANIQTNNDWGLDHGAWTILKHLFPKAHLPVFQLSIDYHKPLSYHFELAKHLKALRQKGLLIIGSGNIVHNLKLSFQHFAKNDTTPADWAIEFDNWVKTKLNEHDFNALTHPESAGNSAKLSIPTPDHYIPLLYTLATADPNETLSTLYEEVAFGGMSMRTIKIGN